MAAGATTTARAVTADALAQAAAQFPDLWPSPLSVEGLLPAEARLAQAIHRTVLQRWLTLEYLLNQVLSRRLRELEPALAGILLSGAAQLVFMERVPVYAVVDEAVSLAKARVRKKAGGLVNAVLRKIAAGVEAVEPGEPWEPATGAVPLETGRVRLNGGWLPDPADRLQHLAVATSHSHALVQRWFDQFGSEQTTELCLHDLAHPPMIVAVEPGFDSQQETSLWERHGEPGFLVWRGGYTELVRFLKEHPARRVQDPTASRAVASAKDLTPRSILDLCAGRGTKTRQLAVQHPEARVLATDIDPDRQRELQTLGAEMDNVEAVAFDAVPTGPYDLVLLDVPCSNTGVLARRPEARYRFHRKHLRQLQAIQRGLIDTGLGHLAQGGYLLYTSCSIDPAENEQQRDYLAGQSLGQVVREAHTFPAGRDNHYHDGAYHVLWQVE